MFDHSVFRRITWVALSLATAGALYFVADQRWADAASLGSVVLVGALFTRARARLPSLFCLLLVLAALVNVLGYALTLWHERTPFDEMVHAFTSFAGCAAISWLLIARTRFVADRESGRILLITSAMGLALGILWEIFEWFIGIIGDRGDTIIDLAMDMVGAVAAGLLCVLAAGRRTAGHRAELGGPAPVHEDGYER